VPQLRARRERALRPVAVAALVLALAPLAAGRAAADEAGEDPSEWLYDPARVVAIDLSLPPASRAALAVDPNEYVDGVLSASSGSVVHGPMDVGIRLKGSGSFRDLSGKAAFKVKFNHSVPGGRFLGLRRLTLNNMVQDASQLHELLAYATFRAAGIPAPRVGYAYVRVDGEDYGVYADVEDPDSTFLKRWFDSTGHLLEGRAQADVTAERMHLLEVDEGDEDDLSDLHALVAAVGAAGDFGDRMRPVADLEEMARMWAVERYVGHWDGYSGIDDPQPNNFFLHSDASGAFTLLPWGTDQTWTMRMPFVAGTGTLFRQCLADEECFDSYRDDVDAMPEVVNGLDLDDLAADTAAMLRPWQRLDPRREQSLEEIDAAVATTRKFISRRPGDIARPRLWGLPDTDPPETELIDGPRAIVRSKSGRRPLIRIRFDSPDRGARFECRFDGASFAGCASPWRARTGIGVHRFRVRAIDAPGNVDATPLVVRWRVARR